MRALVTGCAGFIGSHLSERLLALGHEVVGVDCLTPFYDPRTKLRTLAELEAQPRFELRHLDLSVEPLDGLLDGVSAVYHLAGEPGVRQSFDAAAPYRRNNVLATRRLLDAAAGQPLDAFVYASSSSVYGDRTRPMRERDAPSPVSPYGCTKVDVERLAAKARARDGLPTVGLRFFSIYGPRQRPDMAFQRFLARAVDGQPITIFGDGSQRRDFTYVADAVDAAIAAGTHPSPRPLYNIGGGQPTSLADVVALLCELLERELTVEHLPTAPGDVRHTLADTTRARTELGFTPHRELAEGVALQLDWLLAAQALRAAA